jgi:hypothetical protein
MQRAERQAASGEMPVELFNAEGQHQTPSAGRAIEASDARTKLFDSGMGNGRVLGLGSSEDNAFLICSHLAQRVN